MILFLTLNNVVSQFVFNKVDEHGNIYNNYIHMKTNNFFIANEPPSFVHDPQSAISNETFFHDFPIIRA